MNKNKLFKWIKQFCEVTCLQGPKYIVGEKETLLERVVWGILVLSSAFFGIYLILETNSRARERPTLISVDSTYDPVSNSYFPAVTICDVNQVYRTQAKHFAKSLIRGGNISESVDEVVTALTLLASLSPYTFPEEINHEKLEWLQNLLDSNKITTQDAFKNVSTPCDKLFVRCRLKGQFINCKKNVKQIATSYGYCCTLNYIDPHAPKQVQDENMRNLWRFSSCGHRTGLSLIVNVEPEEYTVTSMASAGIKVIIHGPKSVPGGSMASFTFVPIKRETKISVSPFTTYSANALRNLSPYERNCYFPGERNLTDFELYTYDNCIRDCRQRKTKQLCGCTDFYQAYHDNTKICTLRDIPCLYKYFGELNYQDARNWEECQCYPECSPNIYTITKNGVELNRTFSSNEKVFYSRINITNHSVIHVSYRDLVGTRYRRVLSTTFNQMLGSYGGILSLFLGFSFMWFVELIYFFTLRPLMVFISNRKQTKKREESNESGNHNNVSFVSTPPNRLPVFSTYHH